MSPTDPRIDVAADAFAQPLPIAEVEELEVSARRAWYPVVARGTSNASDAFRFSSYFATIGFIRKYKPYGTKFASPFGYSVFALQPGRGFSVQLHPVAKVEAFHVLAASDHAFVLIATPAEWERHGEDFIRLWRAGRATDSPLAYKPTAGDTFVIDDVNVVHTVVGCTVEEFATTSNDAVVRLHDQNSSSRTVVPSVHASIDKLLLTTGAVAPRRLLTRQHGSEWIATQLPRDAGSLVAMPGRLIGSHVTVAPENPLELGVPDDEVATVACKSGQLTATLRGGKLTLRRGDLVPLAPGEHAVVQPHGAVSRLSVCRVATDLAFADLRECPSDQPAPR